MCTESWVRAGKDYYNPWVRTRFKISLFVNFCIQKSNTTWRFFSLSFLCLLLTISPLLLYLSVSRCVYVSHCIFFKYKQTHMVYLGILGAKRDNHILVILLQKRCHSNELVKYKKDIFTTKKSILQKYAKVKLSRGEPHSESNKLLKSNGFLHRRIRSHCHALLGRIIVKVLMRMCIFSESRISIRAF